MATVQKQHVDLHRQLHLRREMLKLALPGAAYVPFIGDGDIASELYADRRIYGADLDPARVATAQARLRDADVRVADCDGFPFGDVHEPFAVADFDSYSNPYRGLAAFWPKAEKADRIVIFGTDALRLRINRVQRACIALPEGSESPADSAQAREQYNYWWPRYVLPYVTSVVAPWAISGSKFYVRNHMLYWGAIVDRPGAALEAVQLTDRKPPSGRFGSAKKAEYLAQLREGKRRGIAARSIGVDPETIRKHYHADPAFLEAIEKAEMEANELVEDSLFEAARAGNVTAIQVWLYNRSSDRWRDQRNMAVTGPDNGPIEHIIRVVYDDKR